MNPLIRFTMFAAITALVTRLIGKPYALLQKIFISQVGVKESGGANRGPQVDEYNKAGGVPNGSKWCASFLRWCFDKAGIKTTINGWAATAENRKNLVYTKKDGWLQDPQPGDVFTLHDGTRIFHVGFVNTTQRLSSIPTVEGNTNAGGSANGTDVMKRSRSVMNIHSISRWL